MAIIEIPKGLDTKLCVLGENTLEQLPSVLKELWPGDLRPQVVADENTWGAAGKKVQELLEKAGLDPYEPVIFPGAPIMHAEYKYVPELSAKIAGKLPVAVGSGVINDLVKLAHYEAKCPGYCCCATACSVDGYTSYGAAITLNGFKKTMSCPAPLAILADSAVLASAPFEMTAAGYADLAAKIVAGADWFIADAIGVTPIDDVAWNLVQVELKDWLANPEELKAGNLLRMAGLFKGLAATGFAMQYYKESRPASGAEHLFSHVWEMDGVRKGDVDPSHGFKVAVGTLISTALMEETFALSKEQVKEEFKAAEVSPEERLAQVDEELKGSVIYDSVKAVALGKLQCGAALRQRQDLILEKWDEMKEKVSRQNFTFEEMKRRFQVLGCPVNPKDIGVTREEFRRGIWVAAMIRNRYTILDLMFEIGVFKQILSKIEARFEF